MNCKSVQLFKKSYHRRSIDIYNELYEYINEYKGLILASNCYTLLTKDLIKY